MRPAITNNPQTPHPPIIKSLKPLVYNFFLSERPTTIDLQSQDLDTTGYQSFYSQKVEPKTHSFFKPTLQSKKLIDEPKFLLSVQRKKVKIINGISQKASSQQPSRNSYRGSKLKNNAKSTTYYQEVEQHQPQTKDKPIQSQEYAFVKSPRKVKQPNLHFNLRHLLQTRKQFNFQFNHAQNIQGSNFPYYHYFSSQKSSFPKTQRSSRDKTSRTAIEQKRYISTTMGVRPKPLLQNFQK